MKQTSKGEKTKKNASKKGTSKKSKAPKKIGNPGKKPEKHRLDDMVLLLASKVLARVRAFRKKPTTTTPNEMPKSTRL